MLLAAAILSSVLVLRVVLIQRMHQHISAALTEEIDELKGMSAGNDPATGRPFGNDARAILTTVIRSDVMLEGETALGFVSGRLFIRSAPDPPYRLERDRALLARWGALRTVERGRVATPAGPVDYLAVPLITSTRAHGVYVTAIFRSIEQEGVDRAVQAAGGVSLVVLLIGSLLSWLFASRALRPVRSLTQTAQSISESDLSRRIEVESEDEVGDLARTFNEMLERLEEAFATQRTFLDDAAHELRTPITIVRGHLELMDREDPKDRRETLRLVFDELDRMGRMVADVLTLAKSVRPDFVRPAPVDVEELCRQLLEKFQALGKRRWMLEATAGGSVLADRQRLTQAMIQLAQNAVQHTNEDDVITLRAGRTDHEFRLAVRDLGPGIAPEDLGRIFVRFARGGGSRRSDGAGLGLSIVNAIAEAHGGRVEVESRPGEGAEFALVIPAAPGSPSMTEASTLRPHLSGVS